MDAARPKAARPARTPAVFASAKMADAQLYFQRVVKLELQRLLARGVQREDAVRVLLRRIVASTAAPEPAAVRGVMHQFKMNYDDAVRALIVKQELGRLKRKGLDSFAAIEELTRKMQRGDDATSDEQAADVDTDGDDQQSEVAGGGQAADAEVPTDSKPNADAMDDSTIAQDPLSSPPSSPAEDEDRGTEDAKQEAATVSPLTLAQRIGQVSISTAVDAATLSSTVQSSPRSGVREASTPPPTSHGRKRRAPFGYPRSGSSSSEGSISPERHLAASSKSFLQLYPTVKKPKLCDADENNLMARLAPVPIAEDVDELPVAAARSSKKSSLLKRPRPREDAPLLEEEDDALLLIHELRHRVKRHKSGGSNSSNGSSSSSVSSAGSGSARARLQPVESP